MKSSVYKNAHWISLSDDEWEKCLKAHWNKSQSNNKMRSFYFSSFDVFWSERSAVVNGSVCVWFFSSTPNTLKILNYIAKYTSLDWFHIFSILFYHRSIHIQTIQWKWRMWEQIDILLVHHRRRRLHSILSFILYTECIHWMCSFVST